MAAVKNKHLALVFFESSRHQAPHGNKSVETWALGWDMGITGAARWYEIHPRRIWWSGMSAPLDDPKVYAKHLARLPGKKVLVRPYKDITGSVAYPMEKVSKMPGVGTYLASSMAYMLAQAVLEGWKDIGIYGCDFEKPEWQELLFERPNLAYLIGLFRAQGIKITIPQRSTLWELELLDDVDWSRFQPGMKRFHWLYLAGHMAGRGDARGVVQHQLLPWQRVPYYGHETLEEVGATPKRYAAELRREMGIEA